MEFTVKDSWEKSIVKVLNITQVQTTVVQKLCKNLV